jgi:glutamate-1-semialdehyde 2,1-aminomutase
VGPVYQAGTLSANPVAMCAGLAVLRQLADGSLYARLEQLGQRLEAAVAGTDKFQLQRVGSLFWLYLDKPGAPIRSLKDMQSRPARPFGPVFHTLLDGGIYLAPSAFEVGFLSAAHGEAEVDALARALLAAA